MNDNEIISFSDMIMNVFNVIDENSIKKNSKFFSAWKTVVTKISNCGQNLFEHSTIVDIKNNILLIETDHPGWSQMFKMNSKFILNGLKMYVPEMKINSLAFRLKGSNAMLHNINYEEEIYKENQKESKRIEKEEEFLNKYEKKDENKGTNCELPPELVAKFESMKKQSVDQKLK